ncbi:ABC transporter ATP-binding protein [Amycolatopsis taiwanensis]|uniref:Sulfate ABC transporter ATP-binding protein n=1 Tax=Amycolatopsis taiwanensis TaxID=342230 RepID=A0A9W6R9I7_9PSEU|nr:ABC transporter ATP-binding protein [Amycolatopsis taiwanensis]GLY70017.1 sulfate ABC transporter ATP-binding protein [Amycolatopsis taiwanensis]
MAATLESSAVGPLTAHAARLSGVHKTFGQGDRAVVALGGVDLQVAPGEFVCLLGASGCGKTTLLNLIAGLDRPTAGDVEVNSGRPAVMFQEAALMPWLTAAANIELPLKLGGIGRAERKARTRELLDLVRLGGADKKRPHELSGGMRQRVALARALASALHTSDDSRPSLLLMDEPFSALDAITRDVLQGELIRLWRATGAAVVFVTHDVREAVRLGERVVLLSSRPGRVVQEWRVDGLSGAEESQAVDVINRRLREVISNHAA